MAGIAGPGGGGRKRSGLTSSELVWTPAVAWANLVGARVFPALRFLAASCSTMVAASAPCAVTTVFKPARAHIALVAVVLLLSTTGRSSTGR